MQKKEKKSVKKIEKDKKNIIKLNDVELEKILKEKNNESEEKSKQKKVEIKSLKEIKPIDLDTFQEFFYPRSKFSAPVLTKVEQAQEIVNLEQGIKNQSAVIPDKETKENLSNYEFSSPNYLSNIKKTNSQNKQYQPQLRPPILSSRERFHESPKTHLLNLEGEKTTNQDKMQPEFVDTEFTRAQRIRDKLPFEEDERKYKEFRP